MDTTTSVPHNAALDAFLAKVMTLIIVPVVTLLALAAFTVFIWGVFGYIRGADDAEARKKGQDHILWGLIGLMIMFGATAIITFLSGVLTVIQ
jgi:uncharacterized membrane protein